ncbi:SLC29A1 [Bugula neritina]|uniref:SLC29A1 n=1 Tax=Bugula neritina TaxID=10212 RepID=A0A7J7KLS5_BUGNE|nr:SLC29A1 [Bugula neritina]
MADLPNKSQIQNSELSSDEDSNMLDEVTYLIDRPEVAPPDRFKFVYLIFYLLGVGTLLPWNMFITAKDYFMYQLRNVSIPAANYTADVDDTPLQLSYESAVAISNMVANLVIQILNTGLAGRVSVKTRLVGSMAAMIGMFIITLVFTKLNVAEWQTTFYVLTLAIVVLASAASALFGSSLFGLAAQFPQSYTQSIMGGMGLGGVFSAVVNIIVISLGTSITTSAFWYFLLAILVLVFALVMYLLLYKLEFARFYRKQNQRVMLNSQSVGRCGGKPSPSYSCSLSPWLCFLQQPPNVNSTNTNPDTLIWTARYFVPLYCFFGFNMGDLIGRVLAGIVNIKWPNVTIPLLSILRLVFIPLFALCNVQPRNTIPVVFDNDAYPIVIMIIFAVSNGYLSTQALMIAPTLVDETQAELAGSMMSMFMTIGLAAGSGLSYGIVLAIKNI